MHGMNPFLLPRSLYIELSLAVSRSPRTVINVKLKFVLKSAVQYNQYNNRQLVAPCVGRPPSLIPEAREEVGEGLRRRVLQKVFPAVETKSLNYLVGVESSMFLSRFYWYHS